MNPFARVSVRHLVLGLTAASVLLLAPAARAEGEADSKTFDCAKAGLRCTKPDDPSWKFVGEDDFPKLFKDPKDAEGMGLFLVKMKSPEGDPIQERGQVYVSVRYWAADLKLKFEDGTVIDAASMKSFARKMFKSIKDDYKDIKDEKELGEVKGYKFAPKIMKFSFLGVDKKYGNPEWIQCMYFKDNQKLYQLVVIVPAGNEKVFAKDLDFIFKNFELYKVKK